MVTAPFGPQSGSHADISETWQQVLGLLRQRMSQPSFETWISALQIESLSDQSAVLRSESAFNRDWVLKNYRNDLREAFAAVLDKESDQAPDVQVIVDEAPEQPTEEPVSTETCREESPRPWTPRTTRSNLNPKYTFENFVVGQHSRFCHAAALAVAEAPAKSYNPLFLYGGVGLGKTHIMQAIGHYALQHHQDLLVRYVTTEQFTNDLITALGNKDMKAFRERYRKIDILIVDDVQFLEGKERTQEEMFHTFNALHESGKQIVLSSDRPPKNLARLEDRLRSRFEWGLIADIQAPDLETRVAILQKKAEREQLFSKIRLTNEILTYIAELHPNNIRELEGALNKVAAYGMLTQTPLDMPMVESVLGPKLNAQALSADDIVDTVARYFNLRSADLKSQSRAKEISHARQVAIYVIRTLTEASFPKIGESFGGRKHTTILYAFEKMKEELQIQPVLAQQVDEIISRIQQRRH